MSVSSRFPKIIHGGDYNPEQYKEDRALWDEDMRLFGLAAVDIVTLNVFSWALNQPDENTYQFEWLDDMMNMLHNNGVKVSMGTSTAAHPAWMAKKYPDVLSVGYDGRKRKFGRRHNSCPNSPSFRKFGREMVRRLADRYKDHPALLVWHVNNEIGNRCYCENCEAAFRVWLQKRYGTLEKLNKAWYTRFWGHTFYDWDEIVLPNALSEGLTGGNPDQTAFQSITMDYYRFNSDSWLDSYLIEAEAIREFIPDAIITTNTHSNGTYKPLNYHKWAPHWDIVALDIYASNDTPASYKAFRYDFQRGLKNGDPFMIMEQCPGMLNWKGVNPLKRPGANRLWSYQAIARGCDAIMYFQMRRSYGAYEMFHGAMIEHAGHENTRVFRETAELGNELKALGDKLVGARTKSRVGIVFDWESWWGVEFGGGPSNRIKYLDQVQKMYDAFYDNHIPVDFLNVDSDFSKYDIVAAPLLYMTRPGVAERFEQYVAGGGKFITTFFSGVVDENVQIRIGGFPSDLRKLLGIWVEELDALEDKQKNSVVMKEAYGSLEGAYECGIACEVVHSEGADVLASFGSDFYQGSPALTRNKFGEGEAWYIPTDPNREFMKQWAKQLCEENNIHPVCIPAEGVEVAQREKENKVFTFFMNHTTELKSVDVGSKPRVDLLTGNTYAGNVELEGYGVLILEEEV